MAVPLVPGVFVREIDLSQFAVLAAETIFGVIGTASKGPVDEEIVVTSRISLTDQVGLARISNFDHFGIYAAQQYLEQGRILKYVRAADGTETDATTAGQIECAATSAQIIGTIDLSTGINLGSRFNITLDVDGTGPLTINLSSAAADVNNVQILEIVSAINTATASTVAGTDNAGSVLVLTSALSGVTSSLSLSTPATADATNIVFGTTVTAPPSGIAQDITSLPFTANGQDAAATTAVTFDGASPGTHANDKGIRIEFGTNTGTLKFTVIDIRGNVVQGPFDNQFLDTNALTTLSGENNQSLDIAIDPASLPVTTCQPVLGDYFLSGGTDGLGSIADADFIRSQNVLSDPLTTDVNIMATPGISSGPVVQNGLSVCRSRADCFYLVDPPFAHSATGVIDYHNGTGAYSGLHPAFNSTYGAVYWPWIEWFDEDSGNRVFTPPSGWVAGQMAFTDQNADPWFAPAGVTRGVLEKGLKLERSINLADRILLSTAGNNVNSILNLPRFGITIYAQKTLQRTASSTDRVNVRRMLLFAEKLIASVTQVIVFEPNDPATRRRITGIINPILRDIQSRRGLEAFEIRFDDAANPPSVTNQNKLVGKLFLIPTKTAETIQEDFILLPSGAEFTELTS